MCNEILVFSHLSASVLRGTFLADVLTVLLGSGSCWWGRPHATALTASPGRACPAPRHLPSHLGNQTRPRPPRPEQVGAPLTLRAPAPSWAHGGGIWVFFLQGAKCQAQEPSPAPAAAWRSAPGRCCGHTRSGSAWGHRWTAAPGGTPAGPGGCRTPRYCEIGSGVGEEMGSCWRQLDTSQSEMGHAAPLSA